MKIFILMNYNYWYALSINMNKEKGTKAQLMERKSVFKDTHLTDVEYLQRKELVIEKSGKRRVKNKLLMSGYLLVRVEPLVVENEDGTTSKIFPPDTFNLILGTPGIKFFVNCDKDKPIAFRPSEIKKLFDMCDEAHLEVKETITNDYEVDEIVDVIVGPFAGSQARITKIQGNKIMGQIDMFDRLIPAEFNTSQVCKLNTKISIQ